MPVKTNAKSISSTPILDELDKRSAQYLKYEESNIAMTWCGGCGNYGIQKALFRALTLQEIKPHEVFLCYDIGCSGNGSDKNGAYTVHGLHGRILSLAAGAAIANHKLPVVAMAGDGATFSEGVGHLVHALRNNYNVTFVFHNNSIYGLTTGQASATTRKGHPVTAAPDGAVADPINTAQFALSLNPTFVARSFSGDVRHMTEMIQAGIRHQGFSFIEIFQVCPTYNKVTDQNWYWNKIQYVDRLKGYDKTDIWAARQVADDLDEKLMLGILYERSEPHFMERLVPRQNKDTALTEEVSPVSVQDFVQEFL